MEYTFAQYQESAQALRDRLGAFRPRCLLILGSGLGSLGNEVESPIAVPYGDVPHMKRSTAPDHAGRFVFGRLAGQDVAVMQGRLHTYEGWSFEDVSYPVRVLRLLGAETLVVTNAAGADAVGMSTVPEAIVAAHCGMDVLGFTLCTNMGAGVLDQPLSSDEVLAAAATAGPRFSALVKACLARL